MLSGRRTSGRRTTFGCSGQVIRGYGFPWGMAAASKTQAPRGGGIKIGLFLLGIGVSVVAALMYVHGVIDGDPSVARSLLLLQASRSDVFAVAWVPLLGGLMFLAGLKGRLRVAWLGVSLVAVFGAFFFRTIGWGFLLAAVVAAAGLSKLPARPERKAGRHRTAAQTDL